MTRAAIVGLAAMLGGCITSEREVIAPRCLQPVASVEIIGVDAVSQQWINETIAANMLACGHPRPEPRSVLRRSTTVGRPLK